jgi:CRP-like cAMP-binding protein
MIVNKMAAMATNRKPNVFNQISIAAQIIDGSIKINSRAEFENVLKLFPNDPALLRAYADLLVTQKTPQAAADSYGEAADLFIESGMVLQAIVAKSLAWKIQPPSDPGQISHFFTANMKNGHHGKPVNDFFNRLPYSAMMAIVYPLVKIRLQAGQMVKKVGDEERYLYLIVSGTLRVATFQPMSDGNQVVYKKSSFHLSENDFFGDIFPFEEKKLSISYVETITETELIKLSKINLMKMCVKYPEVERALEDLFSSRPGIEEKENSIKDRVGFRQQVPVRVQLQIQSKSNGNPPLSVAGRSRDISIGGICVVLDAEYREHPSLIDSIKDARVQISFPSEDFTVSVPGEVIWSRLIDIEQDTAMALGIKFQEMSPKSRGMLLGFANSLRPEAGPSDSAFQLPTLST